MSCKKCKDSYNPCKCKSTYEPCITAPLVIACDNPEYCDETISTRCVVSLVALPNLGVAAGDRLDTILLKLNTLFEGTTLAD